MKKTAYEKDCVAVAKVAVLGSVLGIKSLKDDDLLKRLESLYWEGFEAGKNYVEKEESCLVLNRGLEKWF